MAKNWKSVESVADTSRIMNVTTQLLGFLTFDHLKTLELSLDGGNNLITTQRQERTQALIKAIHNAPPLERLVFRYPLLKIPDIENLHAGATRLKHLELEDVSMYTVPDEHYNVTYYPPNESLEAFSIRNTTVALEVIYDGEEREISSHEIILEIVRNWIYYIGTKYTRLQTFTLISNLLWCWGNITQDRDYLTTSLTSAVSKLKHLKS